MSTGRALREKNRVHIRWMIRRDMPDVLETELASFEYPWTEEDFLRCLRQRNCIGMVAEVDNPPGRGAGPGGGRVGSYTGSRVVGFMIYELHQNRLHILNFAVHPAARRTGIGRLMVAKLVNKLSTHRRQKVSLAVRERNLDAQVFFRSHDFRATRVLRDYYEDSGEDAIQMELRPSPECDDDRGELVNRIAMYEGS